MTESYNVDMEFYPELKIKEIIDRDGTKADIYQAWFDVEGRLTIELTTVLRTKEDDELVRYLKANNVKTKQDLIHLMEKGSPI